MLFIDYYIIQFENYYQHYAVGKLQQVRFNIGHASHTCLRLRKYFGII